MRRENASIQTITRINNFRNTYIAHQEQELTDKNLAAQELKIWIEALHMIESKQMSLPSGITVGSGAKGTTVTARCLSKNSPAWGQVAP